MSLVQTINYDDENNFVLGNVVIQGGSAKLGFIQNPTQTNPIVQNFNDDSQPGWDYNPAVTTFDGSGNMRQISLNFASVATYISFNDGYNGEINWNFGGGNFAPLFSFGSAQLATTGGKFNNSGYLNFDQAGDIPGPGGYGFSGGAVQVSNAITFNFWYKPYYTGAPASPQAMAVLANQSDNENKLLLYHDTDGHIKVDIWDKDAVVIANLDFGIPTLTQGVWTNLEFGCNVGSGQGEETAMFFVNGVQLGATETVAGTRTLSYEIFIMGTMTGAEIPNFGIDEMLISNSMEHTANFSPRTQEAPQRFYGADTITLPPFHYTGLGSAVKFWYLGGTINSGQPHFIVMGKYWNDADDEWQDSDGTYEQASPIQDLIDNRLDYPEFEETDIEIKMLFPETNDLCSVSEFLMELFGQIYDTTPQSAEVGSGIGTDSITLFTETSSISGDDGIRYQLRVNGTLKYWDTSAWVASDGSFAQANTVSEVNTNITSLNLVSDASVKLRAMLSSDDGTTTPTLTRNRLTYNFFAVDPGAPNECLVYGWLLDSEGNPIVNAAIEVENKVTFNSGDKMISPSIRKTTSDASGYWSMSLISSAAAEVAYTFTFKYKSSASTNNKLVVNEMTAIVPEAQTVEFDDIWEAA